MKHPQNRAERLRLKKLHEQKKEFKGTREQFSEQLPKHPDEDELG